MYYQNETTFNDVNLRSNLSKIKDGAYRINLGQYESIGTHWIDLYVNAENVTYFDSFGVGNFIRNKNIIRNIYRIQAYVFLMYGYFCIGFFFIYFLLTSMKGIIKQY